MDLAKNQCNKFINRIKKDIDKSPDRIKYARKSLQQTLEYIKKLRKEHPEYSVEEFNEVLWYKPKEAISSISNPTRSDMYLQKTAEEVVKNLDLIYHEIETVNKEKFTNSKKRFRRYTSDMKKNIKTITEDMLEILFDEKASEFRKRFIEDSFSSEEKSKIRGIIKQFLESFNITNSKKIKRQYSFKLVTMLQLLDEMGLLEKYNNQNNSVLDNIGLPMLKYEYKAQNGKFGLTDLKNPEFINRFSLEEIIAMASVYSNRLEKELLNYNESMYILSKIGLIDEIYEKGDYKLEVTDEELREFLVQLSFLMEIGKKVIEENYKNYNVYSGDNKVELDLSDNNKARRKSIELYEKDYNELYQKVFLKQYNNNFIEDLDTAIILEIDRFNLYLAKDFAMESLMVMLIDKGKNINWGYIPEYENGKNSIENKKKFVLIGIDMKGFNMPIKLHFDREKLNTFLKNYTGDTKIQVYEGNADMEVTGNGFITTQVCAPLTKEQRKEVKKTNVPKSNCAYRFLEHIKWIMFPNRYPDFLRDKYGKKIPKRYADFKTGRMDSSGEEPDL